MPYEPLITFAQSFGVQAALAMIEDDIITWWTALPDGSTVRRWCHRDGMLFCIDVAAAQDNNVVEVVDAHQTEYAMDEVVLFYEQMRYLAGIPIKLRCNSECVLLLMDLQPNGPQARELCISKMHQLAKKMKIAYSASVDREATKSEVIKESRLGIWLSSTMDE